MARRSSGSSARRFFDVEDLESRQVLSTVTAHVINDMDHNGVVVSPVVAVAGKAAPGALIHVDVGGDGTTDANWYADRKGNYYLNVPLPLGTSKVVVNAVGQDGVKAKTTFTVTRGDILLDSLVNLRAVASLHHTSADVLKMQERVLTNAIEDAAAAIATGQGIHLTWLKGPSTANVAAAQAQASAVVLTAFYPGSTSLWKSAVNEAMISVPTGPTRNSGIAFGQFVGQAELSAAAQVG